ncbi:hypothetical protein ABK040_012559 [Willaertia magna]
MSKFNLRDAKNEDGKKVYELMTPILIKYGLKQIQKEDDAIDTDLDNLEENYFKRDGHFYVLTRDDNTEVIGSVGVYKISDAMCELRKMYLDENFRGLGLGKLLLESAISKAKDLGYKEMELETHTALKEATQLYLKYGFAKTDVGKNHQLCSRCDQCLTLRLD